MSVRPNVLIGTPTYNRQVYTEYLNSLLGLLSAPINASFGLRMPYFSLIAFARNYLATVVLENESYTHLLFIDADMGFRPQLI